jgi:hypothetical protein
MKREELVALDDGYDIDKHISDAKRILISLGLKESIDILNTETFWVYAIYTMPITDDNDLGKIKMVYSNVQLKPIRMREHYDYLENKIFYDENEKRLYVASVVRYTIFDNPQNIRRTLATRAKRAAYYNIKYIV